MTATSSPSFSLLFSIVLSPPHCNHIYPQSGKCITVIITRDKVHTATGNDAVTKTDTGHTHKSLSIVLQFTPAVIFASSRYTVFLGPGRYAVIAY